MSLPGRVEWFRVAPFFLLHAACLLVFVVGWNWIVVAVDISYYLLVAMSWIGLVWDLKPVPARVLGPTFVASGEKA